MLRTDPVRIFIASPGDVALERRLAEAVITRLQGTFGNQTPIQAIFWEHEPLLATAGPQEQLPRPSEVDIVVSILWSRFGTRLPKEFHRPDGSRYSSGTEFELEDAIAGYRARGRPALLVYRKTAEPFVSLLDKAYLAKHEQYQALSAFIDSWLYDSSDGTFKGSFHHFKEPAEFETLLEKHLYKLIEQCLPTLAPSTASQRPTRTWTQGSPFRGLESFDFQHAPIFCGRTRAIGEIIAALNRQAAEQNSFVLITGMSGCGKSSLVQAGIIPLLIQPGVVEGVATWRWALFRPAESSGNIWSALSVTLLRENAFPELSERIDATNNYKALLEREPGGIRSIVTAGLLAASTIGGAQNPIRFVLVVDQLEEILSSGRFDAAQVKGFIEALDTLARSGQASIIATLRSDFYYACEFFPELVALMSSPGSTYHLLPPTKAEISQMIRQPAWAGGLQFEEKSNFERLDDVLRDAASGNAQALPLLEFTLEELYRRRSEENLLTFEAYEAISGLEGSIAQRAEAVYSLLLPAAKASLPGIFHALVGLGGVEEVPTRRQALLDQWGTEAKHTIDQFVEARLFVTDQADKGEAVVSLAHEALLRHWPRLASWVEENREHLRARERIEAAATRWIQEERSPDFLLSEGKQLAEGIELLSSTSFPLGVLETEFVRSSVKCVERSRRRRRLALVTVIALLTILGASSLWQWRQAEERALTIEEKAIEARAESARDMLATRPVEGLDLAIEVAGESLRRFGHLTQPVRNTLKSALDIARETNVLSGHGAPVHAVAFDPKGRWLVSVSADGSLCFWSRKGRIIRQLAPKVATQTASFKPLVTVAVSSDGRRIATGGEAGLQLWDENGKLLALMPASDIGRIASVAFRNNLLASGGDDGFIRFWDLQGSKAAEPIRGHSGPVLDISFDPKRDRFASAGHDSTVRLWDLKGKSLAILSKHSGPVNAVAFAPDGKLLLTGGRDGIAVIWYPEVGFPHTVLSGHEGEITSVAFSPDGRFVTTGSLDRTVRLWTVRGMVALVMHGHKEGVRDVAFDPSGVSLASASGETLSRQAHRDSTVRLWDIGPPALAALVDQSEFTALAYSPDGNQIATVSRVFGFPPQSELVLRNIQGRPIGRPSLRGYQSSIAAIAFSRDGKLIASSDQNGTIHLWDSRGRSLLPLMRATAPITALAFGSNKLLAVGTRDGTIQIWDTGRREMYLSWRAHPQVINALSFSTDASLLASGSDDQSVRLWDHNGREVLGIVNTDDVTAIAFDPGGRSLVSANRDGAIQLFDLSLRQSKRIEGHVGTVTAVAFSPDGKLIASVGEDGALSFWDADGLPVGNSVVAHAHYAEALAFSPDGDALLTAGRDGLLRIWPARDDVWLKVACQRLRWHPLMVQSALNEGALAGICSDLPSLDTSDSNLLQAVIKGDVQRVRELLSGKYPVITSPRELESYIFAATRFRQAEVLRILLTRGVDARRPNVDGDTPLHVAARMGDTEIMWFLLQAGADLEARNVQGDTPLLVATRARWPQGVDFLLRHGANIRATDAYGRSPVAIAFLVAAGGELINRLIEAGANPDGIVTAGELPRDLATSSSEVPRNLDKETKSCLAQEAQGRPPTAIFQCFEAAAHRGSAFAQYELGRAFEQGKGVAQNFVNAAHWYRRAASAREPSALRSLAHCYQTGRGVAQDVGRAFALLRQAAELGDVRAQFDLGLCLLDLDCAPVADFVAAAGWIRFAAESGLESAQLELGKLYELGHGVPRTHSLAAYWYRRAAEQRNPTAMLYLGWLSEIEFESPASTREALKWYYAAAEHGSTDAQRKLGWLYAKGILVDASPDLALKWYRKAAAGGNCAAQIELGRILEARGEVKEAERLYNLAKEAGSTWAPRKLDNSMWATVPRELVYSPCR